MSQRKYSEARLVCDKLSTYSVLSTSHKFLIFITTLWGGIMVSPVLHVRKRKHREVKELSQGPTAGAPGSLADTPQGASLTQPRGAWRVPFAAELPPADLLPRPGR